MVISNKAQTAEEDQSRQLQHPAPDLNKTSSHQSEAILQQANQTGHGKGQISILRCPFKYLVSTQVEVAGYIKHTYIQVSATHTRKALKHSLLDIMINWRPSEEHFRILMIDEEYQMKNIKIFRENIFRQKV